MTRSATRSARAALVALPCLVLVSLLAMSASAAATAGAASCCDGARIAGHEPDVNPALRRFTGIVVAVGSADGSGRHYSLRIGPIGPRTVAPQTDELRGWRLTVLAGKRFASVFRVAANTASEIVVDAAGGTVDGIEPRDVFVVEEIDAPAAAPASSLGPALAPARG